MMPRKLPPPAPNPTPQKKKEKEYAGPGQQCGGWETLRSTKSLGREAWDSGVVGTSRRHLRVCCVPGPLRGPEDEKPAEKLWGTSVW